MSTNKHEKILIIGYGDIGKSVASSLSGIGYQVTSLKRNKSKDIDMIFADISKFDEVKAIDTDFDEVLFIVSPVNRSEEAYRAVFDVGLKYVVEHFTEQNQTTTFTFISSTVVYSQTSGEWVNEDTPMEPKGYRGKILAKAEKIVTMQNRNNIVIRFSGIYGRGSNYLLSKIQANEAVQYQPPYYANRIHKDDCINSILFLLKKKFEKKLTHQIYNATETYPVPKYELMSKIARDNCLAPPLKKILDHTAVQNKRISNKRLIELGYSFQYTS